MFDIDYYKKTVDEIHVNQLEKLEDCLDLEILIAETPICILYDDESFFHCFISDFLKHEQEAVDNWKLKMSEPVKVIRLTEEEIEELRKEGRI